MKVEVNETVIKDGPSLVSGDNMVMITPPINSGYWLARVPVSDNQAIVCFPKFSVIGIGFQHEEDWNTNLPSSSDAVEIYAHIKHNKGDESIKDDDCVEAIKLLQIFITRDLEL